MRVARPPGGGGSRLPSALVRAAAAVLAMGAARAEGERLDQGNRIISLYVRAATPQDALAGPGPAKGAVETSFTVELRDPGTPDPTGGRSMAGQVAIRCVDRTARLSRLVIYADAGLKGAEVRRFPQQTAWVRPEPKTLLDAVVGGVCKAAPPAPRRAPRRAAKAPAPPAVGPKTTASAPPAPPPPAQAAAPAEPPSGPYRIQIGSFPSKAEAETFAVAAAGRARQLGPPIVEPARVGPRRYHRVLIPGFATARAAEEACKALRASGTACLVKAPLRRSGPRR